MQGMGKMEIANCELLLKDSFLEIKSTSMGTIKCFLHHQHVSLSEPQGDH